jgi:hypothetical protein
MSANPNKLPTTTETAAAPYTIPSDMATEVATKSYILAPVTVAGEDENLDIVFAPISFVMYRHVGNKEGGKEGEKAFAYSATVDGNLVVKPKEAALLEAIATAAHGSHIKRSTATVAGFSAMSEGKFSADKNETVEPFLTVESEIRLGEFGAELQKVRGAETVAIGARRDAAFAIGDTLADAFDFLSGLVSDANDKKQKTASKKAWGAFLTLNMPDLKEDKAKNYVSEHTLLSRFSDDYWNWATDQESAKMLNSWHAEVRKAMAAALVDALNIPADVQAALDALENPTSVDWRAACNKALGNKELAAQITARMAGFAAATGEDVKFAYQSLAAAGFTLSDLQSRSNYLLTELCAVLKPELTTAQETEKTTEKAAAVVIEAFADMEPHAAAAIIVEMLLSKRTPIEKDETGGDRQGAEVLKIVSKEFPRAEKAAIATEKAAVDAAAKAAEEADAQATSGDDIAA